VSAVAEPIAAATRVVPLIEAVELNPRAERAALSDDLEVSFVPMAAVEAGSGRMDATAVRRFGDVKKGYATFREGDVLFAKITPCMENGKMAVARGLRNGVGCGSTEFHVLRPRPGVDAHYVYHFVSSASFRGEAAHHMTGAVGQKRVPVAFLERCEIPLPDLDKQRRIVAELEKQFSRLDEAVANLKRVKANLKRYRATVLVQAITGTLVEPCEDRSAVLETGAELVRRILEERAWARSSKSGKAAPVAPGDIDGLPAVPATWTWATLDQIGQEGRSVIYGIIKPGPDTPGGVPYVRVTEMKDGYVDVPSLRRAAREREAKFSRARLLAGDLLISKDGTIGRVAVVPPELEGGNITQHVMRAPIHRFMNRDFVVWAIRSEFCQRWLTGETRGVALRGVNVEDFRRLPIPVPPRSQQDRIVGEVDRRLAIVREVEVEVDANLNRVQALRHAMLAKVFSAEA
jgi:type I restriction enzyme S subunit